MFTPATKDGKTQGAPTTAPKKCCYTVNLRLLLPATVTQCLTGSASRGHRPDPSMELKTIFTIRRTFKAFEDPRQAWGHSVHHWRSSWLRVTGHDYSLCISVISRRADIKNHGCVFCEKLISGAPDSLLLPSWQSQCSHSSSLSSASRSPLSLPEHQGVFTFWMSVPQVCPSTSTWSSTWTLPSWLLTNGSDKEYCASLTLHVASIGFFFLETHIMLSAMLDPNAFRHRVWDHTNKSIS